MSEVMCARTQGERRQRGKMISISQQPAVASCNAGEDTRRAHTWCACPQPGGFAPASHKNHVCALLPSPTNSLVIGAVALFIPQ